MTLEERVKRKLVGLLGLREGGVAGVGVGGVGGGSGGGWELVEVAYDVNSPTTAGLYRVRNGASRLFVKVLNSYRQWPVLEVLPEEFRRRALESDMWRYEADVLSSRVVDSLPSGLRMPEVHHLGKLDNDHLLLVLEDVQQTDSDWDVDRYGRAAELLGRLAARLTRDDALPATAFRVPGELQHLMFSSFIERFALPAVLDPSTWKHQNLRNETGLRDELANLADRVPELLAELAKRPQLMSHGDACPQNLLVDTTGDFVAIDWTLSGLLPAGDDLGQLLIGRAHSGNLTVDDLAVLRELVIDRYHAGLVSEGRSDITADDVRAGLDGSLIVRNAFLTIPLDKLSDTDLVRRRVELTRYLTRLAAVNLTA